MESNENKINKTLKTHYHKIPYSHEFKHLTYLKFCNKPQYPYCFV